MSKYRGDDDLSRLQGMLIPFAVVAVILFFSGKLSLVTFMLMPFAFMAVVLAVARKIAHKAGFAGRLGPELPEDTASGPMVPPERGVYKGLRTRVQKVSRYSRVPVNASATLVQVECPDVQSVMLALRTNPTGWEPHAAEGLRDLQLAETGGDLWIRLKGPAALEDALRRNAGLIRRLMSGTFCLFLNADAVYVEQDPMFIGKGVLSVVVKDDALGYVADGTGGFRQVRRVLDDLVMLSRSISWPEQPREAARIKRRNRPRPQAGG